MTYKPQQGRLARTGALACFLLIGFYAAYKWYQWSFLQEPWFGKGTIYVGIIGALGLLGALCWLGYSVAFVKPRPSEFLIDLDGELRKVVWPKTQPLFDPKTEAWGHTYVVIVAAAIFAALIALIDILLMYGVTEMLFHRLLFKTV